MRYFRKSGVSRIVSQREEDQAKGAVGTDSYITLHTFIEAYNELRKIAPRGDLHIHLYIEETDDRPVDVSKHRAFRTGAGE